MAELRTVDLETDSVSVIIPTWNSSRFILATLDSVCAQTFPPLEILVCDDASTDETESLVSNYPDSRVRWLPAVKRAGLPGFSRNRGIAIAKGRWLAFLDHDDVWYPEKLNSQLAQIMRDGSQASSTEAWRFFPGHKRIELLARKSTCLISFETLLSCNYVVCSSALVHQSLFTKVGMFPNNILYQDYAMWLRISCYTDFSFVGLPLVRYRDDAEVSIRKNKTPELQRQLDVMVDFQSWLVGSSVHNKIYIEKLAKTRVEWLTSVFDN